MRITKWGECGILCALYLARRFGGGAIGAAEIASSQNLDIQYTQQILQRLRKGNIIESERGPRGGYRLTQSPERTNLKDILYAVEGDTFQIICESAPIHPATDGSSRCSTRESCGLHTVWQELRLRIDDFFVSKNLAVLLTTEASGDGVSTLVQLGK